jgi:hypothetical protein
MVRIFAAAGFLSASCAIVDLPAVARRFEAIRIRQPQLHAILDPDTQVGRVSNKQTRHQFGRGYEMIAAPSNATCDVAALWNMLGDIRHGAIDQQLKAEGLQYPFDAGLSQEQADAGFDRREELDCDAPSVAQAVCLILSSAGLDRWLTTRRPWEASRRTKASGRAACDPGH